MAKTSSPLRASLGAVVLAWSLLVSGAAASADDTSETARIETAEKWSWPVESPFRVDRPFIAPAHEYGPGHRGIDLLPLAGGDDVRAPASGAVAFSGQVAGRGVLTIDHGDGLVTTLEPVESELEPGAAVARGDSVGTLSVGGHALPGRVHFGVRLHGEYINPLLLFGGLPRAVLLPCC
ncbi:MAG: M23 family metallopeptidase [Microbacterium sp.]|uniref:murein hydrolase activator EnvC family protein n=1 Tax=Microbacterium sp. TaxID=51671 RepID=UPI0039E65AE6